MPLETSSGQEFRDESAWPKRKQRGQCPPAIQKLVFPEECWRHFFIVYIKAQPLDFPNTLKQRERPAAKAPKLQVMGFQELCLLCYETQWLRHSQVERVAQSLLWPPATV